MKEALFYISKNDSTVQCMLCPHNCIIRNNNIGSCRVRKNIDGKLFSLVYNKPSSLNFDPIEKKPFYHFYPGNIILSIGSIGCNLKCEFCQNYGISQTNFEQYPFMQRHSIKNIISIAKQNKNNIGLSFTYNEPTVWFEYMLDLAKQAKKTNMKNTVVTNGFINAGPLNELINYIDGFSVDLKAFTEDFYKKITSSKLEPVKSNLKLIKKSGRLLEITNLIIPSLNDDETTFEEMVKWIANETGKDTILHLSRYFPTYKMAIRETPLSTLERLYSIAKKHLDYVYLGNVHTSTGKNTYCPSCEKLVISRSVYSTSVVALDKRGCCTNCGEKILSYF